MWISEIMMAFLGGCFGLMVAGGVFTVLFVVGMIPRFAGKTNTARYEVLYEEFIIAGSSTGCILSVFEFPHALGEWVEQLSPAVYDVVVWIVLSAIGIFAGIFVGCLALALAEMIDSIPIMARRIGFRHGIGVAVIAVALGKLCGSVIYFCMHFYE